eukprot:TRINITY_DN36127_c0_g1_i1.p1 TRINITY_DN36127_c0_g1~~TRINITY_DN36127_c0_g1_i1.p1  ORF type:complete len:238 (+),score=56.49 TRINITY_DN36127_c0_g1_i1:17-730(+)
MSSRLSTQRAFSFIRRQSVGLPLWGAFPLRTFASATRITDVSRQPGVRNSEVTSRRSLDEPTLAVPSVTQEQEEAAAMVKEAEAQLVKAKTAANDAAGVAAAIKKVAENYALQKKHADEKVSWAKRTLDEAIAAKQKADNDALQVLEDSAESEKQFLKNAFDYFDRNKSGKLMAKDIRAVLQELKLPAEAGDVDDLIQVLDIRKDDHVKRSAWTNHMPDDIKQALRQHQLADEWTGK